MDSDIGGAIDDYVGCDVSRGLGFAYNGDSNDDDYSGQPGWGANPPSVGVDFFEGPYQDLDDIDNPLTTNIQDAIDSLGIPYEGLGIGYGDGVVDNERMGMRGFVYYTGTASAPLSDPSSAAGFYGFMQGEWATSGVHLTYGGTGFGGSVNTNYAFPGDSDPYFWGTGGVSQSDWSEVTEGNTPGDRRFVQTAGPFTLKPGAVNNLTVGVVYGRSYEGDLEASVRSMKVADTKAQSLFDACFEIVEPPVAPVLTIQEMENELILYLTDPAGITIEDYEQIDEVNIPSTDEDGNAYDQYYRFQGYQIFQMIDDEASVSDITDITKARLVAQCDIEDGVGKLVNYEYDEEDDITIPSVKVDGEDAGITHSFHITEDQFATDNRTLINHKKYYFLAVSYGYNQFKEYDPTDADKLDGQQTPYLVSRMSGTGGSIESVEAIPHNPAPEADGTTYGTYYGWTPQVTQVDGIGNGGNFVKLDSTTEANIVANGSAQPTYENGYSPIDIKVVDPLNVQPGNYTLRFDSNGGEYNQRLEEDVEWTISRTYDGVTETVSSTYTIGEGGEQLLLDWGISVNIKQEVYTNTSSLDKYYTSPIDAEIEFSDSSLMWLGFVEDSDLSFPTNWIRSGQNVDEGTGNCLVDNYLTNECYYYDRDGYDTEQEYEGLLSGGIAPFRLVGYEVYGMPISSPGSTYADEYDPGPWNPKISQTNSNFIELHDVDIVITSDQSKWTKCPVFEINDIETQTQGNKDGMELRGHASVDKNGDDLGDGTEGMGWFPGYAIDVTTGQRLNMAFSENSWLAGDNGDDMIWNPTSSYLDNIGNPLFGGMHYVYVFGVKDDMPAYDEGAFIYSELSSNPSSINYRNVFNTCQWVFEPMLEEGHEVLESDVKISARIVKPYAVSETTGDNNGRPMYNFTITEDDAVKVAVSEELTSALDLINVVPNPYYGYSKYEDGRLDTQIKFTNLPESCTITIYNMQGALIRSFEKDDPTTYLNWDLTNHQDIPISGGVYIIHIDVPGTGEKILKWYGVMRATDLQNI